MVSPALGRAWALALLTTLAAGGPALAAPAQTILFDLGRGDAEFLTGGHWNNVTGPTTTGVKVASAVDSTGRPTGVSFSLTNGFSGWSDAGTTAEGHYPTAAQRDAFVLAPGDLARIAIAGLSSGDSYTFTFFASHLVTGGTRDRRTRYRIGTRSVVLDARNNRQKTVSIETVGCATPCTIVIDVLNEGGGSGYLGVLEITRDGPSAPGHLVVEPGDRRVWLDWDDHDAPAGIAGYHVYRSLTSGCSTTPGCAPVRLTTTPLPHSDFVDRGVANGTTYHYTVTAVADADAARESGYSREAGATPATGDPIPASDPERLPLETVLTITPSVTATAWSIRDGRDGSIVEEFNGDARRPIASVAKVLTGLVALEMIAENRSLLHELMLVSPWAAEVAGTTVAALTAGRRLSVLDGLYAMLLASANNGSFVVAEHFGYKLLGMAPPANPSGAQSDRAVTAFVAEMNRRAGEIGMGRRGVDYAFTRPDGIGAPADHGSANQATANGLSLLGLRARALPLLRLIVKQRSRTITVLDSDLGPLDVEVSQSIGLLDTNGYDGMKWGWTGAAEGCLLSSGYRFDALRSDRIVVAVLGSGSNGQAEERRRAEEDSRALHRWAWGAYFDYRP